jgi:hypothetical protein
MYDPDPQDSIKVKAKVASSTINLAVDGRYLTFYPETNKDVGDHSI